MSSVRKATAEHPIFRASNPGEARRMIRRGEYTGQTAGIVSEYVQGNLCILPRELATDFAAFCQRNPKPCPVIGIGAAGDPGLPQLGDIDIRTDVPRYRVFERGSLVEEPTDLMRHWSEDLVSFVLGCSFSFERPLIDAGIPLQHWEDGRTVPMYSTSVDCVPAGPFRGKLVVSMRMLSPAHAIRAIQISSRFPAVHGAPVHIGLPEALGVADLMKPDFGDPPAATEGLLPVFWACGVTPQVVIEQARPRICITHKPGCMLITDRLNREFAAF